MSKKVHEKLRQARSEKYKSMAEFVSKNDLTYTTYQGHENGFRHISLRDLKKYAALLGKNVNWFIEEEESSAESPEKDDPNLRNIMDNKARAGAQAAQFLMNFYIEIGKLPESVQERVWQQLAFDINQRK